MYPSVSIVSQVIRTSELDLQSLSSLGLAADFKLLFPSFLS